MAGESAFRARQAVPGRGLEDDTSPDLEEPGTAVGIGSTSDLAKAARGRREVGAGEDRPIVDVEDLQPQLEEAVLGNVEVLQDGRVPVVVGVVAQVGELAMVGADVVDRLSSTVAVLTNGG